MPGGHFFDDFVVDFASLRVLSVLRADTTNVQPVTLKIELTSTAFDPFLAVVNDSDCSVVIENDDEPAASTTHSQISLTPAQMLPEQRIMVTSRQPDATGPYALRIRPTLCGLETPSIEIFNNCANAMSRSPSASCASTNPCERDEAGALTGFYCCIETVANGCGRSGAEPIFLVPDEALCR